MQLQPQFASFANYLRKHERMKSGTANFFAKQIQEFTQSGMLPKDFFKELRSTDERAAETFLLNFRHYVQFQNNQYFEDFHNLRWNLGRKHKRGNH
ncbi:MAG TPA: hypothetical protein VFF20_08335 [Pseudogracilibacillus sp.]|nr:hypothetical protein [Pseudogracilibacillus sp.]